MTSRNDDAYGKGMTFEIDDDGNVLRQGRPGEALVDVDGRSIEEKIADFHGQVAEFDPFVARNVAIVYIEDNPQQRATVGGIIERSFQREMGFINQRFGPNGLKALGRRDVLMFPTAVEAARVIKDGETVDIYNHVSVGGGKTEWRKTTIDGSKYANHLIAAAVDFKIDPEGRGSVTDTERAAIKAQQQLGQSTPSLVARVSGGHVKQVARAEAEIQEARRQSAKPGTYFVRGMLDDPRLLSVNWVSAMMPQIQTDPSYSTLFDRTHNHPEKMPVMLGYDKGFNPHLGFQGQLVYATISQIARDFVTGVAGQEARTERMESLNNFATGAKHGLVDFALAKGFLRSAKKEGGMQYQVMKIFD